MNIIGQEPIMNLINQYTRESLPKSILFIGEDGCGKKLISNYLAKKVDLEVVDISEEVTDEELDSYLYGVHPKIYRINLDLFKQKNQNQFLKFIEEPTKNVFVVLTSTSESFILPTILNRCIKFRFAQYTPDQLKEIASLSNMHFSDLMYKVCKTPGQLLDKDDDQLTKLSTLCSKMVRSIRAYTKESFLGIFTKINYKEDYELFDFNLFLNVLEYVAFDEYLLANNLDSLKIYEITNNYKSLYTEANRPVKEQFMINFLMVLYDKVVLGSDN